MGRPEHVIVTPGDLLVKSASFSLAEPGANEDDYLVVGKLNLVA